MVKITYDLNNKDDVVMVSDYYFLKYFLDSLCNDWKKDFDEVSYKIYWRWIFSDEHFENLNKLVFKYVNKYELKFSLEIIFQLGLLDDENKEDYKYIYLLLMFKSGILRAYRTKLAEKFGCKNNHHNK